MAVLTPQEVDVAALDVENIIVALRICSIGLPPNGGPVRGSERILCKPEVVPQPD